jgi:hypothetical protein
VSKALSRPDPYLVLRWNCWLVPVPQVHWMRRVPLAVEASFTSGHLPLCRAMSR